MKSIIAISSSALLLAAIAMVSTHAVSSAQPKAMREILPLPDMIFDASGKPVPTESLRGKIVALYFSAHWCVPCKKFTPKLVSFREANKDNNFEVVFMSLDHSPQQKTAYMKEEGMRWLTAPGQRTKEINFIMDHYKLPGVPSVVVFGPEGQVITTNGRADITNDPEGSLARWRSVLR